MRKLHHVIFMAVPLCLIFACQKKAPVPETGTISTETDTERNRPLFTSFEIASNWYQTTQRLDWIYPESTAIYKAGYHEEDKVMLIFFTRNPAKGYIFGNVPEEIWEGLKQAPSKGKYYNLYIRGKYGYALELEED